MSEQPIELRLAVAEARIEALTAVVIAMAVEKSGDGFPSTMIRWRHTGTSFVLEQWKKNVHPSGKPFGIWVEVPCVMPEQGKGE